ncbi:PRD domain-containing protein [Pasteurella sp. PK-2025]|uniref:PRD domain-containing protein n=1 Tax=unclassified Pasteurella TaxID=2621516 RepID=UPI003C76DFDE
MNIQSHLELLRVRKLIDQEIIDIVFNAQTHLAEHWHVNVKTSQVTTLLTHLANALGRIKRQHCASPLHKDFQRKIQNAVCFPIVFAIHQDILNLIPFPIPANEQTYFLANYYTLLLDQPHILEKLN